MHEDSSQIQLHLETNIYLQPSIAIVARNDKKGAIIESRMHTIILLIVCYFVNEPVLKRMERSH